MVAVKGEGGVLLFFNMDKSKVNVIMSAVIGPPK